MLLHIDERGAPSHFASLSDAQLAIESLIDVNRGLIANPLGAAVHPVVEKLVLSLSLHYDTRLPHRAVLLRALCLWGVLLERLWRSKDGLCCLPLDVHLHLVLEAETLVNHIGFGLCVRYY